MCRFVALYTLRPGITRDSVESCALWHFVHGPNDTGRMSRVGLRPGNSGPRKAGRAMVEQKGRTCLSAPEAARLLAGASP